MPGSSTEGSALPASTKMSSAYDLFDITSAMDWYEGEGGLLGGSTHPALPEAAFPQDLLPGLDAFSREEQQPTEPSWCSKGFCSSYEMSRDSPSSTMIPTGSHLDGRQTPGACLSLICSLRLCAVSLLRRRLTRTICHIVLRAHQLLRLYLHQRTHGTHMCFKDITSW